MRALLTSFFRWLFPQHVPAGIPTLNELKSQLRLHKKATTNAKRELPPSEATQPDEVEASISQRIAEERARAEKKHQSDRDSSGERLARAEARLAVEDIRIEVVNAVADFKVTAEQSVRDLHLVHDRAEREQHALHDFRKKHRLTAPAVYHDSNVFHWGLISMIFLLEVAMSGFFFSQGHSMGYLGGLSLAIAVSMCNIGLTILASLLLLRQLFHRNWFRKLFFGVIYAAILAAVALINFFFAHVRDEMSAPEFFTNNLSGTPNVEAIFGRLLSGSLGFQTLDSYLFLGITSLFCIIAIVDIYMMEDPYPGYAKRQRRSDNAYEDLAESRKGAEASLKATKDDKLRSLDMLKVQIHENSALQKAALASSRGADERHEKRLRLLHSHEVGLISFYRKTNSENRQTPPPRYFDETLVDVDPTITPLKPLVSPAELQELQQAYNTARLKAVEDIQRAHEEAVARINHFDFKKDS